MRLAGCSGESSSPTCAAEGKDANMPPPPSKMGCSRRCLDRETNPVQGSSDLAVAALEPQVDADCACTDAGELQLDHK
eukprot:3103161-Amphidinium_carterae.1